MANLDLTDEDVTSAAFAMQRAGVLEIVLHELIPSGFTLTEFLQEVRTPPRLNATRRAVWKRAYGVKTDNGAPYYSTPELGRLFNRDHTTLMRGIRKAP